VFNFIFSFIGYATINFIGYYIHIEPKFDSGMALLWFLGLPVILYFILGFKLNPLDTVFLSFLSTSSSVILPAVITSYEIIFQAESLWRYILNASFGVWQFMITDGEEKALYILVFLPSILMCAGMFCKYLTVEERRNKQKRQIEENKNS